MKASRKPPKATKTMPKSVNSLGGIFPPTGDFDVAEGLDMVVAKGAEVVVVGEIRPVMTVVSVTVDVSGVLLEFPLSFIECGLDEAFFDVLLVLETFEDCAATKQHQSVKCFSRYQPKQHALYLLHFVGSMSLPTKALVSYPSQLFNSQAIQTDGSERLKGEISYCCLKRSVSGLQSVDFVLFLFSIAVI